MAYPCEFSEPQQTARYWLMSTRAIEDPVIIQLAEKLGKTPAQIVLSWIVQRGVVVLTKSVTPSRIKSNLEGEWRNEQIDGTVDLTVHQFSRCLRTSLRRSIRSTVITDTTYLQDWELISSETRNLKCSKRRSLSSRRRLDKRGVSRHRGRSTRFLLIGIFIKKAEHLIA